MQIIEASRLEAERLAAYLNAQAQLQRQEMQAAANAAAEEHRSLSLFEAALLRLERNDLLQLTNSSIPSMVRSMMEGDGVLHSLPAPMLEFVTRTRIAFDQILDQECGRRGRVPGLERFLVWHSHWTAFTAPQMCSDLQLETGQRMTYDAAITFLGAVFHVFLGRLLPARQEQEISLPSFKSLSERACSQVAYCAGYSVYKVVMRELRKKRENQDHQLIQVLDGIQWQRKSDAIQACKDDQQYGAIMLYTIQRCQGDVTKPFSGLRYLRHPILPAFFLIEQLAAHFLAPKNMQQTSFTQLQHAVESCSEIWDLWFAGLEKLGFYDLRVEQAVEISEQGVFQDDTQGLSSSDAGELVASPQYIKAFGLLSAQYLRIWLRESLRKLDKQKKMDKLDALRTTLKNRMRQGKGKGKPPPPGYEEMPDPPSLQAALDGGLQRVCPLRRLLNNNESLNCSRYQ